MDVRAWIRKPWVPSLGVLAIAIGVFVGSVQKGNYDVRACAVEYPHDGQCGLEAMADDAVGALVALAILAGGMFWVWRRWFAKQPTESEQQ
jgi:hypothetical protein